MCVYECVIQDVYITTMTTGKYPTLSDMCHDTLSTITSIVPIDIQSPYIEGE